MGKIVVTEFISLDGVIEDPGGSEDFEHGGWSFEISRGDEGDRFKLDELMESDALLLGRTTYEGFAEAWPSREGEFADKFNQMPKYVVSDSMDEAGWENSTVIGGADLAAEVEKLKAAHDGDVVVHGSATPARRSNGALGVVHEAPCPSRRDRRAVAARQCPGRRRQRRQRADLLRRLD